MLCYASLILLLIQSGDIEIYPGLIERVIRAILHQEDQKSAQTVGTQCMYNALYSVGYLIIKKVRHFTTWDMHYILIVGNILYSALGFRSQLLSVDKFPSSVPIENIMISITKTNLETGLMTRS